METINASIKMEDNINAIQMLKNIERYGRVAYKSEDKITEDSAIKFVKMLLKLGHESVLEHEKITLYKISSGFFPFGNFTLPSFVILL